MPIRINLLAEALAEEELRRRDPVKRAIYLGALLVVLSLVWFSSVWLEGIIADKQLAQIQAEIQGCANEYSEVENSLKQTGEIQKRLDDLRQLSAARFLQGNLLNALQKVHIPNVQLTGLRVDQKYAVTAGTLSKTNASGTVTPGRPGTSTQQIVLTLDVKDSSPNPGDAVNPFKDFLTGMSYFKSCLDTNNGVRLSRPPTQQIGSDGKPYVLFTLECHFQEVTR
jgi:hypothetical protein